MVYTCPISIYAAGALEKPQLKARNLPREIEVRMSTPKVLTPGQLFTVETTLENRGFSSRSLENYMIFGDGFQSRELELNVGYQAKLTWSLKAPQSPGNVRLSFFSSSGDLLEEELTVISARHMRIESISVPENMSLKDSIFINITVIGLEQVSGELQLRIDEDVQTRELYIDKNETKSFTFPYTPASEGNREICVILLSEGQYEDGMIGNLLVIGESSFWEQMLGAVAGFLKWIASLFGF
jgi:hypothetical protein